MEGNHMGGPLANKITSVVPILGFADTDIIGN